MNFLSYVTRFHANTNTNTNTMFLGMTGRYNSGSLKLNCPNLIRGVRKSFLSIYCICTNTPSFMQNLQLYYLDFLFQFFPPRNGED